MSHARSLSDPFLQARSQNHEADCYDEEAASLFPGLSSDDGDSDADDQSQAGRQPSSSNLDLTPTRRRARGWTAQTTPRKRRMSIMQRAAARLRSGSDLFGRSAPARQTTIAPASQYPSSTSSNETADTLEDDIEYPKWLHSLIRDHGGPSVAFAYQLSDRQHATIIPLRGSYPVTPDSTNRPGRQHEFGFIWSSGRSRISIDEFPKPRVDSSAGLVFSGSFQAEEGNRLPQRISPKQLPRLSYPDPPNASREILDTTRIPVEIWEHIMQYLCREDIKSLRLVNKSIERCTSARLFRTVVVPFSPEIYGVLSEYGSHDSKTKALREKNWFPRNSGLNVFRGFGRHIRNFAMSFEVDEASLADPPTKVLQQGHESYWGKYDWPFPQYARFKDRADLELTADETSTMKLAFSHLNGVTHLALSLDCGLGWLGGPDFSIRTRILRRPGNIFGSSFQADVDLVGQRRLWSLLEDSYEFADHRELLYDELVRADMIDPSQIRPLIRRGPSVYTTSRIAIESNVSEDWLENKTQRKGSRGGTTIYASARGSGTAEHGHGRDFFPGQEVWQLNDSPRRSRIRPRPNSGPDNSEKVAWTVPGSEEPLSLSNKRSIPDLGILYTRQTSHDDEISKRSTPSFIPGQLTKDQREWLLESAWAQDAFLSSYLLAVADNASSFRNVKKLTLTRISSRHLPKLCRDDFWDSLPSLENLDLRVIPDHRDVRKSESGFVDTPSVRPADAIAPFNGLLSNYISSRASIRTLCIGWADGGEHAEGLFARNHHLLPSPLTQTPLNTDEGSWKSRLIRLPHVQNLTLFNCWLTPNLIEAFLMTGFFVPELVRLRFDTVSLTAHPKFDSQVGNNRGQGAQLFQQMPNLGNQVAFLGQAQAHAQHGLIWNMNNAPPVTQHLGGLAAPAMPHTPSSRNPLREREGSWSYVLHNLERYCSDTKRCPLHLSFLSCGYVRLPGAFFDQTCIDEAEADDNISNPISLKQSTFFSHRKSMLAEFMMTCADPLVGHVASGMTAVELLALKTLWRFDEGWPSREVLGEEYEELDDGGWGKWGEKSKQAAVFDGARPGGTGRFSGTCSLMGSDLSRPAAGA